MDEAVLGLREYGEKVSVLVTFVRKWERGERTSRAVPAQLVAGMSCFSCGVRILYSTVLVVGSLIFVWYRGC